MTAHEAHDRQLQREIAVGALVGLVEPGVVHNRGDFLL